MTPTWKELWERENGLAGRSKKAIKNLDIWVNKKYGKVNYYNLIQFLGGDR